MENKFHYQTMAKAIEYLRHNYQNQPDLDEVANSVHLSKFHFQRIFKKWVGISPKEFLQYTTLEQAKRSLLKGQSTLQTAYDTGLSGNSRLHDLFVKIEACTPGQFQSKGEGLTLYIYEFETPFGTASIAETERGVSNLIFGSMKELKDINPYKKATFVEALGRNGALIKDYFSSWKIPSGPVVLHLAGTPFQIQVWKALLQIPSASLLAYQDVAKMIEKPEAARAVGSAIGKNPVAYLIPCHRVIKSSGEFGNYHWEPERKVMINAYESVVMSDEQ